MYNSTNLVDIKYFALHFTSCYGSIWLVMLTYSIFTQNHVNVGEFGVWGFPLISLVYAFLKLFFTNNYEKKYYDLKREHEEYKQNSIP